MSQAVLAEMWPCHIVTPLTTDLFDRVAIETTQSSSPDQLSISSLMPLFSFWSYHNYPPWQCLVLPAQSRRSFPAPALLSSLGCRQRDLRGKLSRCNILLFVSIIFVFFSWPLFGWYQNIHIGSSTVILLCPPHISFCPNKRDTEL